MQDDSNQTFTGKDHFIEFFISSNHKMISDAQMSRLYKLLGVLQYAQQLTDISHKVQGKTAFDRNSEIFSNLSDYANKVSVLITHTHKHTHTHARAHKHNTHSHTYAFT